MKQYAMYIVCYATDNIFKLFYEFQIGPLINPGNRGYEANFDIFKSGMNELLRSVRFTNLAEAELVIIEH